MCMFRNADEVLAFIRDNDVKSVDVRFCDLPGIMQHFTVPAESFDESVFTDGLAFDGSSIRGFQAIHESDMQLLPDPTTAFIDPFRTEKTLAMNFFIHDPLTGEAYSRDPRNVARKAEAYLVSTGIADTAYFGPEAEFYIFDEVRFETSAGRPCRRGGRPCRAAGRAGGAVGAVASGACRTLHHTGAWHQP